MPLTGEAKRQYMAEYHRRRRAGLPTRAAEDDVPWCNFCGKLVSALWGSRVADYELDAGVSWLDNVMELRPVVGPSVIVLVTCPTIRSGPSHRGHFKEYFRGWTGKLNW